MGGPPQASGGFFSGLYGVLGPKIQQMQANEQKAKDAEAQYHIDAINSGRLSPEQIDYAHQQIMKIYGHSKPVKELLGKVHEVIGKVTGHGQDAGQSGGSQPAAAAAPAPAGIPAPPAAAASSSHGAAMSEAAPGTDMTSAGPAIPLPPGATSTGQSATQQVNALPPPPSTSSPAAAVPSSFASMVAAGHPSPQTIADEKLRVYRAEQESERDRQVAVAREQAKMYQSRQRPILGPAVSVTNARQLAAKGQQFYDEANEPIDLATLPDGMGLKQVIRGGMTYWVPFSPNQRQVTVGNEIYAVSPMDIDSLKSGGGTRLGQKSIGRTSTREAIGVDANGNPVKQVLTSTSTPDTPGVTGGPVAPRGIPAPPTTAPSTNGTGGSSGAGPAPRASGARPAYMTPGMYSSQSQRAVPVRNAANQIFGDPSQPDLPSMTSYAPLVDDAASRDRVGQAMRIVLHEMEGEESKSGRGYLTGLLANYGGLPQALASSQNEVIEDALNQLSPQEKDMVDTMLAAYGSIVGLRSLTKASAAQASVKKLENELPIPGVNVQDSRQYLNKLSRLAEEVWTGASALSDQVVPEKQFYKEQVGRLVRARDGVKGVPPPPPSGSKSVDDEILKLVKQAKSAKGSKQ
jgi:hypothetical protein